MAYRAVIFDLGGVVLGSPLHAIRDYELELGIPNGFVNRVVASTAPTGAWSRLERGELVMEAFFDAFEADCQEAGRTIDARVMMERMAGVTVPRPEMLEAIRRIRANGLKAGALTNNWKTEEELSEQGPSELAEQFDDFVESSRVGLRKPDPLIYHMACERLDVRPSETVFLDDIGSNLKAARGLGMHTIKVIEPRQALGELQDAIGLPLLL